VVTTQTIELLGRDGIRLVGDAVGDPADPPVLLAHGGGQTRHSWHTTTTYLGTHGWYAVSLDLRGHGDSEWAPDGDYSVEAFSSDLIEVCRTLGRPAMIGASLGGTSSLLAAARRDIGDDPRFVFPRRVITRAAQADAEEWAFWVRVIEKGRQDEGDLAQALAIMARHGAMDAARADALAWAARARAALQGLPDHPLKVMLDDLAGYVVARVS
jgi:pimeloyl-ACP methyl ester carboxylesterase